MREMLITVHCCVLVCFVCLYMFLKVLESVCCYRTAHSVHGYWLCGAYCL
jgi:hypothetical protein